MEKWYCSHGHEFHHPDESFLDGRCRCPICKTQQIKEHDSEPQHCWEFRNCLNESKNHCIVYQLGIEKECWVTNRMKPGNPGFMNGSCINCQWFRKNIPPIKKFY